MQCFKFHSVVVPEKTTVVVPVVTLDERSVSYNHPPSLSQSPDQLSLTPKDLSWTETNTSSQFIIPGQYFRVYFRQ